MLEKIVHAFNIRKLMSHFLYNKTNQYFCLKPTGSGAIQVDSLIHLIRLYIFCRYDYYQYFYQIGFFETKNLKDLMSSLSHKHPDNKNNFFLESLARLYHTPPLFFPLLFPHDESFIGFYSEKNSQEHCDYIAQKLDLHFLDTVFEVGLSAGCGQIYLTKKHCCRMKSLVGSIQHQRRLENYLMLHSSEEVVSCCSLDSLEQGVKFSKIIWNNFYEAFDYSTFFDIVSRFDLSEPIPFYIQGLFPQQYLQGFVDHRFDITLEQTSCYREDALAWLDGCENLLYRNRDKLADNFYRQWRLYFIDRLIHIEKKRLLPYGLLGTLQKKPL